MDTKYLITLIRSIMRTVSSKHTQWWDTLHYTDTDWEKGGNLHSDKLYTVKFSTTHFNSIYNSISKEYNLLRDYSSKSIAIARLKYLLGGLYQIGYVCCKTDMPPHRDRFETGSHRVLMVLSSNSILIQRTDMPNITVSQGDFFFLDTNKEHGATVVEGEPDQEYVIIENSWYSFGNIPTQLTDICV